MYNFFESSDVLKSYSVRSFTNLDYVSTVVNNYHVKLAIDNNFDQKVDRTPSLNHFVSELFCMQFRERDYFNSQLGIMLEDDLLSRRMIISMNFGLYAYNMLSLLDYYF